LTTLWHRSKNWQWKNEEMVPFAQPLLDYSLAAYIEGWIRNEIRLLKVRNQGHTLSAVSRKQEPTSQKALHNPWSLFLSS
jgi:hypothetical protein